MSVSRKASIKEEQRPLAQSVFKPLNSPETIAQVITGTDRLYNRCLRNFSIWSEFFPCRIHIKQTLSENDKCLQIQMCEWFNQKMEENVNESQMFVSLKGTFPDYQMEDVCSERVVQVLVFLEFPTYLLYIKPCSWNSVKFQN